MEIASIEFFWCFWCIASFICMLITVKKDWSNHVVNDCIASFIFYIETWCITAIIFHGDDKVINKNVGNICWVFQRDILINSHKCTWVLLIFKYCLDEAKYEDRGPFGLSRKFPEHSSFFTYNSEHGSKSTDGSHIVEGEVHVDNLS